MKLKKILSLILATSMTIVIVGCGNANNKETSKDTSESKASTVTSSSVSEEKTSASEEVFEKNLYGFDEPVTIKYAYNRDSNFKYVGDEDAENNSWIDLYKEHNIIPELLFEVESAQFDNKVATGIVSGSYPDFLWANASNYADWIESGVIADITDAFEEYASEQLRDYVYSDGGGLMNAITHNGRLYGIPYMADPYNEVYVMYIRQDWLDNLGLQIPETMEDLKKVEEALCQK